MIAVASRYADGVILPAGQMTLGEQKNIACVLTVSIMELGMNTPARSQVRRRQDGLVSSRERELEGSADAHVEIQILGFCTRVVFIEVAVVLVLAKDAK